MKREYVSRLVAGVAVALLAAPAAWAQSAQEDNSRSTAAQADDQTTSSANRQDVQAGEQSLGADRQDAGQTADQSSDQSDGQARRAERQEQRQERRQEGGRAASGDRQPAIGVSVIQRGGLGVRVMAVVPESPAADAGIRPGDTILEVEGRPVGSAQQLVALIQQLEPGDMAEFAVIREGREYQVPVRLTTREQALPPRLRRQDGSQAREFAGSQNADSEQLGRGALRPQRGQEQGGAQSYDRQQNYQYGSDQQDRGRSGPPEAPRPDYQQNRADNPQTFYGGQSAGYSEPAGRNGEQRQLGERLAQRLSQFEQRLERLSQRLDEIERNGGLQLRAGVEDADATRDADDNSPDESARGDQSSSDQRDQDRAEK